MATAPIIYPHVYSDGATPWTMQTPALPNYTTDDTTYPFVPGQFLKAVSGTLRPYVSDDTAIYGLSLDASHSATAEPYASPFGTLHNPVALRGNRFIMNISDAAGDVGSGSTTQGDVTLGTLYSGVYLASPYGTILALDASDFGAATKNIFQAIAFYNTTLASDGDASTDFNGRVIVQILSTAIQS